jgi:hypothetical protein
MVLNSFFVMLKTGNVIGSVRSRSESPSNGTSAHSELSFSRETPVHVDQNGPLVAHMFAL